MISYHYFLTQFWYCTRVKIWLNDFQIKKTETRKYIYIHIKEKNFLMWKCPITTLNLSRVAKKIPDALIPGCGGKQKQSWLDNTPFHSKIIFVCFLFLFTSLQRKKKWGPKFFRNGHPNPAPWESTKLEEALF